MITLLIWIFVKIPFLFIALAAAIYLVYIKKTYQVIDAECISCVKQEKNKNYLIDYSYVICENNIIDQANNTIESSFRLQKGKVYKLFVKNNKNEIKMYYETICAMCAIISIALILVILI